MSLPSKNELAVNYPSSKQHSAILVLLCFLFGTGITNLLAGSESNPQESAAISSLSSANWITSSILHPDHPFELVPGKDPNGWSFLIEPYGWAPGVYGNIGVRNFPTISVNTSPVQVLQKLDWGAFMRAEIHKGRWGLLADGFYAQFSASGNPRGPVYNSASVKLSESMDSLAASFRVIDKQEGFVDLYAGARYNYIGVSVNGVVSPVFQQKVALASQIASADPVLQQKAIAARQAISAATGRSDYQLPTNLFQDRSWIDPLVGLRGQINLTHWLYLAAQADVGGFGAGSQITWNTQATIGANLTRTVSIEAGYRYMYIDYDKCGLLYQVSMPGVFGGVAFRF